MSKVEQLLEKNKAKFQESITHPLTNELCDGTLPDYKLYTFLVQDLQYFHIALRIMGKALSLCTNGDSLVVLGKQVALLAGRENDYFDITMGILKETSLKELQENIPLLLTDSPVRLPQVKSYIQFMEKLIDNVTCYAEIITYIYVMEKVYLGWAQYNSEKLKSQHIKLEYKHQEWIDLHSGEEFETWVKFLANEIERASTECSPEQWERCNAIFAETVQLEINFFEGCYNFRG